MPLNSGTGGAVVAYSYIRFSTPEQAKGDSLERQLGRSREWASRHRVRLDESLIDRGVSAFKSRNAAMGHLKGFLDLIREGRIARGSYLLIESLDRLSRDEIWPALSLIGEILTAVVTIVTLSRESGEREYTLRDMNRPDGIFGIILD